MNHGNHIADGYEVIQYRPVVDSLVHLEKCQVISLLLFTDGILSFLIFRGSDLFLNLRGGGHMLIPNLWYDALSCLYGDCC